jgi:hypothetical protein
VPTTWACSGRSGTSRLAGRDASQVVQDALG